MNSELLKPLKGCRLESVRVSKSSFALELEKFDEGNRSLFELSTNGYVVDDFGEELNLCDSASLLTECLECDVIRIDVLSAHETIKLGFSNGREIAFSTKGIGTDSIAIVKDKLHNNWFLVD